ncbi:MAG: tetratricopeptide repeat protein [Candidatus Acidiferrales bacterium]
MGTPTRPRTVFRFAAFELDATSGELRKHGFRVRLQDQPLRLLLLLIAHPGDVVTRDQVREELWGRQTFVDFDRSLNKAVVKLRQALGDDAETPRFVETLPRRGYRFLMPVEASAVDSSRAGNLESAESWSHMEPHPELFGTRARLGTAAGLALGVAVVILVWLVPSGVRDRVFGRSNAVRIQSVGVLPLENLSGDPAQDDFADGMTDELTTSLARIRSLRVISRTSMMQYRKTHKPVPEIARELNVDAVVEGSVVRSGNKVRITTQLIDARRDVHLWAQSYEREIGDLLDVEDSISLDIASQVKANLSPEEHELFAAHHPVKPAAYEAYLRGRNELSKQSQDAINKSIPYFQQAIEADPLYAAAYAGLADSYSMQGNYMVAPPKEVFPRAKAAATRALELDPTSAEAHAALGLEKHHFEWDWAAAEAEYKRAIELNPGYALAYLRYSEYLSNAGRHDEALRAITHAEELDPLSLVIEGNVGRVLFNARRYDEAIAQFKKTLDRDPNRLYVRIHLAMSYEQLRKYPESLAEFENVTQMSGGHAGVGAAHAFATAGQPARARAILKDVENRSAEGDPEWFFIAGVYAALGEKDHAFAWLEEAYRHRDFFLTYLTTQPYMDPLRSDPRYAELVHRLRIPE